MHGVPSNLKLQKLVGLSLVAIRPLENILYVDLGSQDQQDASVHIGIQALWHLRASDGTIVTSGSPGPFDGLTKLAPVGARVITTRLNAPDSFVLAFDSGHEFEVFDSNQEFESFCIPKWAVYV